MAMWKAARLVFFGGPHESLPLKGRLVRNSVVVFGRPWDPKPEDPPEVEIAIGSQGIIVEESRERVTVAYSKRRGRRALRLQSLGNPANFNLVAVSWASFKQQFEIEYWVDKDGNDQILMPLGRAYPM